MAASPQTTVAAADSTGNLPESAAARSAMLIVFLTVFIDLLGFGIVLPVLPRQAEPYLEAVGLPVEGGAGGAVIGVLSESRPASAWTEHSLIAAAIGQPPPPAPE